MSTEETTESTVTDEINTVFEEMATEEAQAKTDSENTEGSQESGENEEVASETEETNGEINEQDETTEIENKSEESGSTGEESSEVISGESQVSPLISDELFTRAVQAGIPLAHARKFENEESLLGAVEHYEKAWKEAEADAAPAKKDPLSELPTLDPDVHDPQVIAQFDRLIDIIKQEREAGQTETQAMQERLQDMEDLQADTIFAADNAKNAESAKWFNGQISGLGKDFQEALGEGDTVSLNQQSKQLENRGKIVEQILILESGYEARGLEITRDELFEKAARSVLQDEYQQLHETKLSGKLEKRAGQHISRAGGQKVSGAQTPTDFAVAELERKFGIKP